VLLRPGSSSLPYEKPFVSLTLLLRLLQALELVVLTESSLQQTLEHAIDTRPTTTTHSLQTMP
jgi:hypothetical protein